MPSPSPFSARERDRASGRGNRPEKESATQITNRGRLLSPDVLGRGGSSATAAKSVLSLLRQLPINTPPAEADTSSSPFLQPHPPKHRVASRALHARHRDTRTERHSYTQKPEPVLHKNHLHHTQLQQPAIEKKPVDKKHHKTGKKRKDHHIFFLSAISLTSFLSKNRTATPVIPPAKKCHQQYF